MTENQRLKMFREHKGKTQRVFADICGLKQGSYADVERGKVNVSGDIKIALNKEYSLNIGWLETGSGRMESEKNNGQMKDEEFYINRIKELEAKIAELKEDKKDLRDQRDKWIKEYDELKYEQSKKRELYHDNPGSTEPAGESKHPEK